MTTAINVDLIISGPFGNRSNPQVGVMVLSSTGVLLDTHCCADTADSILRSLRKALSGTALTRLDAAIARHMRPPVPYRDRSTRFGAHVRRSWAFPRLPRWVRDESHSRASSRTARLEQQRHSELLGMIRDIKAKRESLANERLEIEARNEALRSERLAVPAGPTIDLDWAPGAVPWAVMPEEPTLRQRCIEAVGAMGVAGAIVAALGAISFTAGAVLALVQ